MNQRIKELMHQSMDHYSNGYVDFPEFNPEKFAQLIVKECVAIVDGMTDPEDSDGYFWAIQNASQKIKKHFGLKQ